MSPKTIDFQGTVFPPFFPGETSIVCFFAFKPAMSGKKSTNTAKTEKRACKNNRIVYPGIPTTIKTMGLNITTIAWLRVLIIGIGSTIGGGSPGYRGEKDLP